MTTHTYTTMSPTPSFQPPSEQMCKINFSPLRSPSPHKRFNNHGRNQSEAIQRPRPISVADNSVMVQHAKRSSIYVADASYLTRTPMASPTSDPSDVVDHYAILELTPKASNDEIRAAYRRLRSVYFTNDAKKYRALQNGFDCLMDPESRQVYDATYQPAAAATSSLSSIGEVLDQGKHWRKDSAHGDDANAVILEEEEEEEEQDLRTDDPNWALKRFQCDGHEIVLGSEPYQSYIPLPMYSLPVCGQPKYIGNFAVNAWPN
ncbi:hypothetical protein BKA58DRAFT_384301 [Alternaria rosae]|uniref:uncharacterized protein n=1 Tax=Alternaria rosae TaxID=1187941 RepID=UPI001E8EB7C4|nr:uncharacterized protein BKA58DRAFT_384301 [Alternaria rosae]KAH6870032.1 hypothetical protein BKA58DRAFT_384301 [Alternaria rosae]